MKTLPELRIKELQAFAFDVDGVLFPNENWWFSDGTYARRRSLYDGQAISLLRAAGLRIAFVTSARGEMVKPITDLINGWNRLPSTQSTINPAGWPPVMLFDHQDSQKKKETVSLWLNDIGISHEHCGAMGDDLVDIPMLESVGFAASPIQSEQLVKDYCHFVSTREAGSGAIRDVVNYVLKVKGIDPLSLNLR